MTRTRFSTAFVTACAAASLAALAWLTPSCDLNPHPLPPGFGSTDNSVGSGQGPGGGSGNAGGGGGSPGGGNTSYTAGGDASDMNPNARADGGGNPHDGDASAGDAGRESDGSTSAAGPTDAAEDAENEGHDCGVPPDDSGAE